MTNFKISQEEKNRILEMHSPKKIISEQKKFLAKLFGGSVDDIFKMFSDDAVKSMDDVFAKIFTKPINLVQKGSQQFLKSASGAEVSMKTVQDAIQLVTQGKLKASEIATYLPRQLADGSEFRSIIVSNLEKRGVQKFSQTASKLPLGEVGQDFKNVASRMNGWIQITNNKGNMSGWKFHVYADTLDEVAFLYEKLLPVVKKYGVGFKAGSGPMMERLAQNAVQKGKGVTLYLPSEVISQNTQKEFLSDLQSAIKGYEKTGQISGDRMITNNIGYRYELSKPIDASKGVDMSQYKALYKANEGGGHNIPGNPDLFN